MKNTHAFLNRQLDEMANNLEDFCKTSDAEKLRAVRLNAKKFRAVLSLIESCLAGRKMFSIKKLKKLFHVAGEIRTAQLNIEALELNNLIDEEFRNQQKLVMEKGFKDLCERRKKYTRDIKKLARKTALLSLKMQVQNITDYYFKNIQKLSIELLPPVKAEVLHDGRKTIKKLLLAFKALPEKLQNKIDINKKYLDHLQDKLGQWHDLEVTLHLLPSNNRGYKLLNNKKEKQFKEIEDCVNSFNIKARKRLI